MFNQNRDIYSGDTKSRFGVAECESLGKAGISPMLRIDTV